MKVGRKQQPGATPATAFPPGQRVRPTEATLREQPELRGRVGTIHSDWGEAVEVVWDGVSASTWIRVELLERAV